MNERLRRDGEEIARRAIQAMLPDRAVRQALADWEPAGRVFLVAVGKAAWPMADAAVKSLKKPVAEGIVLTKYGHCAGGIPGVRCLEGGHPVPDAGSFRGTREILAMTEHLTGDDTVLFLLSGGGSALFEDPAVEPEVLQKVTQLLLKGGADITELNTIRKRLSRVKAGRFAQWCAPAKLEAVILSDVLGDRLDVIASGPAAADPTTAAEAAEIGRKYGLDQFPGVMECLNRETPKKAENVRSRIIGSVRQLCRAAREAAEDMGYETVLLTDTLDCEAREAGQVIARLLADRAGGRKKTAFIAGGETVVHVTGAGHGGRNQELALAAVEVLAGIPNAALISVGSDGTDGPTDAAGGYADGDTLAQMQAAGVDCRALLQNNDAYHALEAVGNLIKTGPTGTNVNDVVIGLIGEQEDFYGTDSG